ncbi:MAG: hypothetical protein WBV94_26555 [Blastocatellia bacterium]
MPILENVSVAKLPERYRPVFDSTQPLSSDIRFIPEIITGEDTRVSVILGGICALAAITALGLTVGYWSGKIAVSYAPGEQDWTKFVQLAPLWGAFAAWMGYGFIKQIFVQLRIINALKNGTPLRYGVFLTPDALVWRDESNCTLLPRDRIVETVIHENKKGQSTSYETRVSYLTESGEQKNIQLPLNIAKNEHRDQLVMAINEWLNKSTAPVA